MAEIVPGEVGTVVLVTLDPHADIEAILEVVGTEGTQQDIRPQALVLAIPKGGHIAVKRLLKTDGVENQVFVLNCGLSSVMLWPRDETLHPIVNPLLPGMFRELVGRVGEALMIAP